MKEILLLISLPQMKKTEAQTGYITKHQLIRGRVGILTQVVWLNNHIILCCLLTAYLIVLYRYTGYLTLHHQL